MLCVETRLHVLFCCSLYVNAKVKELLKSMDIYLSYREVLRFYGPLYILTSFYSM